MQPLVSTVKDEIKERLGVYHVPSKHGTVCETLLSTQSLWQARTIVLLGDVVYSNSVFGEIMSCTDPIRVFGNTWEVFAISFDDTVRKKVVETLEESIAKGLDKLRYFYKVYCGFDPYCDEIEATPLEKVVFWYVHDWTCDIDEQYKYDNLRREVIDKGVLNS